jgi:transcriptional regulator of aromatic amino acid metabolism
VDAIQKRQPVAANARVICHHEHRIEERVDRGTQRSELAHGLSVVATRETRLDVASDREHLLTQYLFDGIVQQVGIDLRRNGVDGLAKDVTDPLVRGRESLGVRQREKLDERAQPRVEIERRGRRRSSRS